MKSIISKLRVLTLAGIAFVVAISDGHRGKSSRTAVRSAR